MKNKISSRNLKIISLMVFFFPVILIPWNGNGQQVLKKSQIQKKQIQKELILKDQIRSDQIPKEQIRMDQIRKDQLLKEPAQKEAIQKEPVQIELVQREQVFLHPGSFNKQVLNINVIQGEKVTRRAVANMNDFKLAGGENLAIIEGGDKIKLLPDGFRISGIKNIVGTKSLLPESYFARLQNGTTALLEVILICQSKLIINRDDSRYHGFLTFQLVNPQEATGSGILLNDPINFTLLSGSLDTFMPDAIKLDRTNSIVKIECAGRKHLSDSVDVNIVTSIKKGGYKYYMGIEPYLEMNITKSSIKGLGIQDALVTVTYLGSGRKDSIKVAVDATRGAVKPNTQFVKFNEPAEFIVRSESTGAAEITANSKFAPLKVSIYYAFPWLYLILPFAGGVIGAFAKSYDKNDDKPIKPGKLLAGGLLGFTGAIAWYVLGINLAGIEWKAEFNELAAVGIGAVITLIGIKK